MAQRKTAKTSKKPAQTKPPTIQEMVREEVAKQMPKVDAGVNVAIPNTTKQKLQAICDTAAAVKHLAAAISSVNVFCNISGNTVQNTSTGILVGPEKD